MIESIIYPLIVWIGLGLTLYSKEKQKKRYIGWVIAGLGLLAQGINVYTDGHIIIALLCIVFGLIDLYLAYYWYKRYKIARLSDRERFLREMEINRYRY